MKINVNTIGGRISLGFATMTFLILLSGLLAGWQSIQLAEISARVRDIRGPTIDSALTILNGINQSQSELKSWLLVRLDQHKERREEVWTADIQPAVQRMAGLAPKWSATEDIEVFEHVKKNLTKLAALQETIEALPKSSVSQVQSTLDEITPMTVDLRTKLDRMIERRQKVMDIDLDYQAVLIRRLNIIQGLLILLGGVLGFAMGYIIIRSTVVPIQRAIELADKIAGGHYGEQALISGSEEARRLGVALERMRQSLENKAWLHRAQISFNEGVRAVGSVRELAEASVSDIARSLRALSGVFYVREERKLKAMGGFAHSRRREPGMEFRFGEGLAGQSAAEKRMITVPSSGESGMEMSTNSGDIKPTQVLALPLVSKDEVIGAMEFGLSAPLSEHEREFLAFAMEAASVVLNAVQRGEQVKNLLAETQTQAEELQAQQEELKNANDELQTRQEELESTNEELEEQKSLLESQKMILDQKNVELEKAQGSLAERAAELDRVSRYKSEFLANMSHELRTPLNSQLILSKLLEENREGNLTEKQKEFAKIIHSTGLDLLQLINDILDLSKVEAGKLDLEIRDCEVREIVGECERDFRRLIENKGLKFDVKVDDEIPAVIRTDSHRLLQVLKNFLSNAFKFTSKGRVELRVSRPTLPKVGVAFTVADTGIGIPKEKVDAVFQAFEQVDSSVSREFGGTGLGLAISKSISALLGGEVSLETRLGEGSSFTLIIPESLASAQVRPSVTPRLAVLPTPAQPMEKTQSALSSPRSGNLMLIIEDDRAFADVLVSLAKEKGFDSILATDGMTGLELAVQNRPSCILLDYRLPGLDGLSVLRELKNNPATKHIPVHMISVDDRASEARRLGAVGYLVKPVDAGQILEAIDRMNDLIEGEVRRVLVIEDDPVQREEIMHRIAAAGVTTKGVERGAEAIDLLLGNHSFDCLIVDLALPDMSGAELLKRVHDRGGATAPPAIVYTSKDLSREEEEMLRRYSDSIIIKGVRSSDRLIDEMNLFLNKVVRDLPRQEQKIQSDIYQPEKVFQGKEILLVDDDVRNIFSLSSALEGKGFKISLARNGQEALAALAANPKINLVLMDIMMPVMDGYEATRRIRANPVFGKVPVIALTAKAMKGDREACLAVGATDYLSKPVDVERLLSLLRVWLAA
ncbi:MAG: response regulator [Bdellovibrionales bacterium]